MKIQKQVTVGDGKKVTVVEMTVRQLLEVQDRASRLGEENLNKEAFLGLMRDLLPKCTEGISDPDEMLDFAPSELEALGAAFLEVNKSFLSMLEKIGVKQKIIRALKKDIGETFEEEIKEPAPDKK